MLSKISVTDKNFTHPFIIYKTDKYIDIEYLLWIIHIITYIVSQKIRYHLGYIRFKKNHQVNISNNFILCVVF